MGRKTSMFVGGLFFLIGALLNGFAQNIGMLIVGRLLLGFGVGYCNQIAVGTMIALKFGVSGEGSFTRGEANLLLFFICAYVAAYAWSWGPLGWLVPSEICSLEVRSAGQAINVAVNMLFTFAIAQIFLNMLCHLKFGLFFFFAGFVLIMTVFIALFLPETKNVPIEEMNKVWKSHWFWTKFVPSVDTVTNNNNRRATAQS
ncbi:hypothetical protein TSUD_51860 [Trifolium subterraneum]|uniref:Major facilitator superfamily (MFS) profile domain-containing protein n=1 Tax=Trifolium subterraneum TaxID=3900 RepID=A0A2Z6MP79_TRISU|nr:hypothetical protein TSUD_51860 [Trifolium subterraneum]